MLEDRLRAHPLVSQCMVVGDQKPFIACLVTLDPEALPGWAQGQGQVRLDRRPSLADDPDLHAEIQSAVDEANKAVSKAEAIRKFAILPEDWTEEGGQMTPSLKLKRSVVMKEYADAGRGASTPAGLSEYVQSAAATRTAGRTAGSPATAFRVTLLVLCSLLSVLATDRTYAAVPIALLAALAYATERVPPVRRHPVVATVRRGGRRRRRRRADRRRAEPDAPLPARARRSRWGSPARWTQVAQATAACVAGLAVGRLAVRARRRRRRRQRPAGLRRRHRASGCCSAWPSGSSPAGRSG